MYTEDLRFEFLIEEYKALRKEIDDTMNQMRRTIIWNIVASGALWSFIYANNHNLPKGIHWIPPLIWFLFGSYYIVLGNDAKKIGGYIRNTEKKFLKEGGWENYLHALRP